MQITRKTQWDRKFISNKIQIEHFTVKVQI